MFSGLSVSCIGEVVGALGRGVGVEWLADCGDDGVEGSGCRFARQTLELGEETCLIGFRSGEYLGRKNSLALRGQRPIKFEISARFVV
jgi:hypothetical protein